MTASDGAREEIVLKVSIAGIRQEYNYLTELLIFGELDVESYLRELNQTVAFDGSGEPWAISPGNGNWYRLTEEGPVLGEPPEYLYRPAPAAPVKFCAYCGSRLQDEARFCRECGKPVKGRGGSA